MHVSFASHVPLPHVTPPVEDALVEDDEELVDDEDDDDEDDDDEDDDDDDDDIEPDDDELVISPLEADDDDDDDALWVSVVDVVSVVELDAVVSVVTVVVVVPATPPAPPMPVISLPVAQPAATAVEITSTEKTARRFTLHLATGEQKKDERARGARPQNTSVSPNWPNRQWGAFAAPEVACYARLDFIESRRGTWPKIRGRYRPA